MPYEDNAILHGFADRDIALSVSEQHGYLLKIAVSDDGSGIPDEGIILTACSDFEYAKNALNYGAADYLLKPFHDG